MYLVNFYFTGTYILLFILKVYQIMKHNYLLLYILKNNKLVLYFRKFF